MQKELDKILCEKYPEIFRDRNGNPMTTAMCWGFSCGDGWFNIIDSLCNTIQQHIKNVQQTIKWTEKWNANVEDPNFEWVAFSPREKREVPKPVTQPVAIQVKEKFGTLRVYYTGGDSFVRGAVDMAENQSAVTCEMCGAPGELSTKNMWLKTLCESHRIENDFNKYNSDEMY